ncbi:MAG: TetR/AcrR family transcriptional regulator [Sphingomonadaceae bacterium]
MVRVVKAHSVRRNEILDVAQRLVYTKGYEQMTIQDILDSLQIAKGTFFHYFDSKPALLEALIERMLLEMERVVRPIVDDPCLPALEKLQRFCATLGRWKTERKDSLLALLRVWYADENAIVRQKVSAAAYKLITPLLTAIIRQGVREGALAVSHPEHTGGVVLAILLGLGESFAMVLLSPEAHRGGIERIESSVAAYNEALERVLGAPTGVVQLVDAETLGEWFVLAKDVGTGTKTGTR